MYSKTIMIGPIHSIKTNEDQTGTILMTTTRPFPDDQHNQQRDYIEIHVWKEYFDTLKDYLYEGQLISVEGRIESKEMDIKTKEFKNYLFAELIINLTNKK